MVLFPLCWPTIKSPLANEPPDIPDIRTLPPRPPLPPEKPPLEEDMKPDISSIEKINSDSIKIEGGLIGVSFIYILNYSPNIAKIEFKGNILLSLPEDKSEEIIKKWKEKKLPEEFKVSLFNIILKKSNIKAIQLEEELGIPIHLPLPSVNLKTKEEPKDI